MIKKETDLQEIIAGHNVCLKDITESHCIRVKDLLKEFNRIIINNMKDL